jgi:very-short-patch-repair endonuclease
MDGAQHGDADRRERDKQRDAVLEREGFRTIRFFATDVLNNLEGVSFAVRAHLGAPHPGPPHEGEGGGCS